MSVAWFLMASPLQSGKQVLSAEESRHVGARRLRPGDEIVVFDGEGRTASARIEGGPRKAIEVDVGAIERASAPSERLVLATGIPKGERLGVMLQMWTQLGLTSWQPLVLANSAVRKIDPQADRLRRIGIEGCKVARRPWPLRIEPLRTLEEALASAGASAPIFFGDRDGAASLPTDRLRRGEDEANWVFVGPEAGFEAEERRRLRLAGALPICLSEYNLRIETAAVAAVTWMRAADATRAGAEGAAEPEGDPPS